MKTNLKNNMLTAYIVLIFTMTTFYGVAYSDEESGWFTEEKWQELIDTQRDRDPNVYQVNVDSEIDKLKESSEADSIANKPRIVFKKNFKITDDGDIDKKTVETKVVADSDQKVDTYIDPDADQQIYKEPMSITRAREAIEELDRERTERLRDLRLPSSRRTGIYGGPSMSPPPKSNK